MTSSHCEKILSLEEHAHICSTKDKPLGGHGGTVTVSLKTKNTAIYHKKIERQHFTFSFMAYQLELLD